MLGSSGRSVQFLNYPTGLMRCLPNQTPPTMQPKDWCNDNSDRAERTARAHRQSPDTFRHNRIARQNFEPFVVALVGREVLYCEKLYCVVRVAQVFTDDWGFEAIAVPRFGFRIFDYPPGLPTRPWTFGAQWALQYLDGFEMGGGVSGWQLFANDELVEKLRVASRKRRVPFQEIYKILNLCHRRPSEDAPPCPWKNDLGGSKWWLNHLGDITYCVRPPELGPPYEQREVKPFEHLLSTKMFFIGYAPGENLNEFAFRALLKEPGAGDQFCQLASHPSAYAARMYGVLGLKLLRDFRYQLFRTLYWRTGHPVRCKRPHSHWSYIQTSELVKQIDRGALHTAAP